MSLNYCGGIPEMPKADIVEIVVFPDSIKIVRGFRKGIVIHFENIKNVSLKTDEQISKDVTLTRLLALGIFAFAAKKKRKNITNYLLIDYVSGGIDCTAIFTGDNLPKVSSQIAKSRQKFLLVNPPKEEPLPDSAVDVYSEIEKLHDLFAKGIISEDEFSAKKRQLLGV